MKKWRNILQRDDYIVSFKGLDSLALKPEIPSEQKPIFRLGYEGGIVCRRELRTEEEYLKDFTPFVNKKTSEYLEAMRKAWFEPNGLEDSVYDMFFGNARTEADAVEEEEEFIHDDWASLLARTEEASTLASDARGIFERHVPSSEAHGMVGGGGSVAAAAATALPYGGSEDLEAKRAELERVQDTLQRIHEIKEELIRLRQPREEGGAGGGRAPMLTAADEGRAEVELERLYRSLGHTPGEVKDMMKESEAELRVVPPEAQETPEFKAWERYFERTGKRTRGEQVEHARTLGVSTKFVASAKRTNHAAIIYGLLKAGKRAPPTVGEIRAKAAAAKADAARAGVGPSGGGAGGGGGPGGGP